MLASTYLMGLGVVLLIVGIVGAISGGHAHQLAGLGTNAAHNAVHSLTGIAAIVAARISERAARIGCQTFAVIYGVTWLAGLLNVQPAVQMLNLNTVGNWLHFLIFGATAWFGFRPIPGRRIPPGGPQAPERERERETIGSAGRRY